MTSSQAKHARAGGAKRSVTARRWGVLVSAAVVVGLVAVPTAANAAGSNAHNTAVADVTTLPTAGLSYVALGDSYSSGLGVDPQTDQPAPGCGQSANNYPHQIAAALGLNLTDVTCAGATADNITSEGQQVSDGTTSTTLPIQLDALSASTDVVTLTVGGNNLKFTDVALACAARTANGPLWFAGGNECQTTLAPKLQAAFSDMITTLGTTYALIRSAAPNAKIFVLGYPSIAPATSSPSCFSPVSQPNSFPFTDADVPFLHGVETRLDTLVQTLAKNPGANFTYVPTFADSTGHSACAATDAYVNGAFIKTDPTTGVPVIDPNTHAPVIDEKSLHPNATGVDFMAATTEPLIAAAFPATVTSPTPTPSASATDTATPAAVATTTTAAASASLAATGQSEPFIVGAGVLALLFVGAGLSVLVAQRKQRAQRR